MVQFECPRHSKPPVSFTFVIGKSLSSINLNAPGTETPHEPFDTKMRCIRIDPVLCGVLIFHRVHLCVVVVVILHFQIKNTHTMILNECERLTSDSGIYSEEILRLEAVYAETR